MLLLPPPLLPCILLLLLGAGRLAGQPCWPMPILPPEMLIWSNLLAIAGNVACCWHRQCSTWLGHCCFSAAAYLRRWAALTFEGDCCWMNSRKVLLGDGRHCGVTSDKHEQTAGSPSYDGACSYVCDSVTWTWSCDSSKDWYHQCCCLCMEDPKKVLFCGGFVMAEIAVVLGAVTGISNCDSSRECSRCQHCCAHQCSPFRTSSPPVSLWPPNFGHHVRNGNHARNGWSTF